MEGQQIATPRFGYSNLSETTLVKQVVEKQSHEP